MGTLLCHTCFVLVLSPYNAFTVFEMHHGFLKTLYAFIQDNKRLLVKIQITFFFIPVNIGSEYVIC